MKIQSAGRLGNILFIWSYAIRQKEKYNLKDVTIFADKYHTILNKDLFSTFQLLENESIKFEINNKLGFILRILDKISSRSPNLGKILAQFLKISSESQGLIDEKALVQRGYFQDESYISEINFEIYGKLEKILVRIANEGHLKERFPFLNHPYQAIHVRLTDYVGSNFGVIDIESQLPCLENDIKSIICTDGTYEEIASRVDISNFDVLTPQHTSAWETLAILAGAEILITTNSTLSWWAGFISSHHKKKIWVPKYWNPENSIQRGLPLKNERQYVPKFESL